MFRTIVIHYREHFLSILDTCSIDERKRTVNGNAIIIIHSCPNPTCDINFCIINRKHDHLSHSSSTWNSEMLTTWSGVSVFK